MDVQRPLPNVTEVSAPYWAACREHRLLLQWCAACERFQFFPRPVCVECHTSELQWKEVSGRGHIYTFTVVHRAPSPGFEGATPYVVALIELDEGPRMMSNVVGVPAESLRIGTPVRVVFEDVDETTSIPLFELDGGIDVDGG